jgi:hypothetical protein
LKKEELLTLLEEIIAKVGKEVTGKFFFPKVKASNITRTTH